MIIWFNLLIPLIAIVILAIFFTKKIAWWEYFLLLLIPVIAIFIAKTASVYDQVQTTEFWNSYLVRAQYTEEWSTWIKETCERCVERDTSGRCTREEEYDCSHCDENPPKWEAWDNTGRHYNISQAKFEELCRIWGKRQFEDQHRNIRTHGGFLGPTCGKDGDVYVTSYDGRFNHIQAVTWENTYENRVKCSKSIFNFPMVDSADISRYKLYRHAPVLDPYSYNPVYGGANDSASRRLSQWNAWMGSAKQIHMNILVFRDQSYHAAELQEWYWKRGNKNELVLCIGVDRENKITWAKVFSWTEAELLKIKIERTVAQMPYDLPAIADTMGTYAQKLWVRKKFKDFKYISVEPTFGAILGAFIATILLTVGLVVFILVNDFDLGSPGGSRKRYRGW